LPLLLSVVPVVLIAGSLSTSVIVERQGTWLFGVLPQWNIFTPWGLAGFLIFLVSALAESNRSPFDLLEAESELVTGYNVEYSSMTFALFYLGEYGNMILVCAMTTVLFLGGWLSPVPLTFANAIGMPWLAAGCPGWLFMKLFVVLSTIIWFRATFPRYRYDQIMRLGWKVFIPITIIWIVVVGIWTQTPYWIWWR